jgi:hypothetical protein
MEACYTFHPARKHSGRLNKALKAKDVSNFEISWFDKTHWRENDLKSWVVRVKGGGWLNKTEEFPGKK